MDASKLTFSMWVVVVTFLAGFLLLLLGAFINSLVPVLIGCAILMIGVAVDTFFTSVFIKEMEAGK